MDSTSTAAQFTDQDKAISGSTSAPRGGAFRRAFDRIFSRHTMNMAVLVVLPVIFTLSLNSAKQYLQDPDIWWHLADARTLCTTHQFMHTVPNSFTVAGQPWVNPEWLSELPYWFSYQVLGLRGIYLLDWLVLAANLVFLYWRGFFRSGHPGAALYAGALGFLMLSVNAGPRTIAIAYLAMSSELAILDAAERGKTRLLWLLPPLFCLWINLHGSWLIGLGLLVLYILCGSFSFNKGAFSQEAFTIEKRNHLLKVLGLSVAALMLNPYGWRLVWNPIDMMMNQKLNIANVMEWKPLNLSTIAGGAAAIAMCLMVLANCLKGRKWRVYEIAFIFFAWYAALDHMRFLFMAAVLTIPFIADDIARSFELEFDPKTIPAMNALMVAGAAGVFLYMFPGEPAMQKKLGSFFPMESIAAIQPSWRTFNYDTLGGMMAFQSKPSYIDSRFDTFEHHGEFADYLRVMYGFRALEIFDKHRIDHVIMQENVAPSYFLSHTPGWTVIKREKTADGDYLTFARTPGSVPGSAADNTQLVSPKQH
jgi:hypothetical protein